MAALAEMYVQGVSTRKVKAITEELCGHSFSASAISAINQRLDASLGTDGSNPASSSDESGEVLSRSLALVGLVGCETLCCERSTFSRSSRLSNINEITGPSERSLPDPVVGYVTDA